MSIDRPQTVCPQGVGMGPRTGGHRSAVGRSARFLHHRTGFSFRQNIACGFTLVEVLIALVLLSFLMLGMVGAMRAMSATSEGVERRIDISDRFRVTSHLLGSILSDVSVRRLPGGNVNATANVKPSLIFYEASPTSLVWIGVMPARFGVGGRHYMRLAQEGSQLVLRYAPWSGASTFSDWGSASAQVIAEPVTALDLRYLDPESLAWLGAWPPPDGRPEQTLPQAIEVTIHGMVPPWPPLVVSIYGLAASDPSARPGSWGPGS